MSDPQTPNQIGNTMITLAWIGLLVLLIWFFNGALDNSHYPSDSPASNYQNGKIEVSIKQNSQGHYLSKGQINDQSVTFLIDTGATNVAISEKIARQLQLEKGPKITINTANGQTQGYLSRLKSVQIGDIRLINISAVITPHMDDEILLGMSFLKHLEFTQRNKHLILRQYQP